MSLSWLRKRVAFDRLLARLVAVSPDRWVLKGALALEYRLGPSGRPTKDADLVRLDDEPQATADLLAAQALDLGDHFTLAIEQHVAEKVHAYTRRYAGDEPSSRPKDLVDIVLVQASIPLDAHRLHLALEGIFAVRGLQPLPPNLPPPPIDWQVAYRRMAVTVGIPEGLDTGYQVARRLLDPVLAGLEHGRWDPGDCRWRGSD